MKIFLTYIIVFYSLSAIGQNSYVVELNDKSADRIEAFFNEPSTMLTQKALDRRTKFNISLDSKDLAIDKLIIEEIELLGANVLSKSKWLNALYVSATDEQIVQIRDLSTVKSIRDLRERIALSKKDNSPNKRLELEQSSIQISSDVFIKQVKIDQLHLLGLTGEGVSVAVIDAGFSGANNIDAFTYLRTNNKILGTYNFIHDNDEVYNNGVQHGTMVLSTMAANIPGTYVGASVDANYWLLISEDVASETPIEEFYWLEAAEFADSVGVDIINTSLGYNEYQLPFSSYVYEDFNGESSYISRGADIAISKGIISVNSQGNSGNTSWKYLLTPADAKGVISVGAVDEYNNVASLSSYGPSADGRVKPEVSAMGYAVPVFDSDGNIVNVNGTSGAAPIVAGGLACLLQAYPNMSPSIAKDALTSTASINSTPDNRIGYGLANFKDAYVKLSTELSIGDNTILKAEVLSNPFDKEIVLQQVEDIIGFDFYIYNNLGVKISEGKINKDGIISTQNIDSGIYYLKIEKNDTSRVYKLIKK